MQTPPPVDLLLEQLNAMAGQVESVLDKADLDWLRRPGSEQWSLTEIACHLRDVEREVHQARFRSLLERENAFISGVSPDEWAGERNYQAQDGPLALRSFLMARRETLAMLSNLEPEMWPRQGRHAFFGPTSMHELLFLVVRHDEIHWQQIQALLP